MGRWQWLILMAVLLGLLVAALVAGDAMVRIYQTLALLSPWVARLVLLLFLALMLAILVVAGYYLWLFLRPLRRSSSSVPEQRSEAAWANLGAVQRQVEGLQDRVAQQALAAAAADLQATMARGDLTIAVFGVGAAGKTSLINSLVGAAVGLVGPALGTTRAEHRYPWQLPSVPYPLWLIDTPGLAEPGVAGRDREQVARRIATQAALILFVVDNDLHQGEFTLLQDLLALGKRLVVVLNKADRYPSADLKVLLAHLRSRLVPPLTPQDIVAIAADPKPLPQVGGGWLQRAPNLDPLLARMADILRAEADDLIADTILLQSQQLGERARQLLDQQRQRQADQIIDRYQWLGAAAIAVTPLPGLDFLATAAINAQMVVELSQVYGCRVSLEEGKSLALSLAKTLVGLGLVKGSVDLLALGLQTNLVTALGGRALKAASGAYLTRIAGKSFSEYFRHNQNWGDGGMAAVVSQQFQLNQREAILKVFIQKAVTHLMPLVDPS